jgi:hypothetical protein
VRKGILFGEPLKKEPKIKKASRIVLTTNIQKRPICKFSDCTRIFIN